MSRSRKKTPVLKDGGRSSKEDKQYANRRFRRRQKHYDCHERYDEAPLKSIEVTNSWDINDSVSYWPLELALRWRKNRMGYFWAQETVVECIADWKKWYYYK